MIDAIQHTFQDPSALVPTYALLSRIRLSSSTDVIESAQRVVTPFSIPIRSPTSRPRRFRPGLFSGTTHYSTSATSVALNSNHRGKICNSTRLDRSEDLPFCRQRRWHWYGEGSTLLAYFFREWKRVKSTDSGPTGRSSQTGPQVRSIQAIPAGKTVFSSKTCSSGLKANLFRSPFGVSITDPQQLLVVGIERLEATWVCKPISSCSFTLFNLRLTFAQVWMRDADGRCVSNHT